MAGHGSSEGSRGGLYKWDNAVWFLLIAEALVMGCEGSG